MSSSRHPVSHPPQEQEPDLQTLDSIPSCSNDDDEDDDLYAFDFDPPSPPHTYFFSAAANHAHNFRPYSDSQSDSDSDFLHGEDDDQMNFITDLFASREVELFESDRDSVDSVADDVSIRVFGGSDGFGSSYDEELGLGFGPNNIDLLAPTGANSNTDGARVVGIESDSEELGLGFGSSIESSSVALAPELGESLANRGANSSTDGLRVVGFDSDSDSEDVDHGMDSDRPFGDSDIPLFWDCLGFEEQRARRARAEELDWEEVEGRVDERESSSSVIDRVEEVSVSSEVSSTGEETSDVGELVRSLEWQILLAVNNLGRSHEFDHDGYVYEAEYDMIFGQFVQTESALKGSPPAAKAVVENLPSVVLTEEEVLKHHAVCAVCKDEIMVEEEVTRLPCCHHYHGECIVPWLGIRNTCPVCRYELPTDDPDYEQRKTRREEGLDVPQDLQMLEFIPWVGESQ